MITDASPNNGGQTGPAAPRAPGSGFRGWTIVWGGQFASMLGSNFTSFSLAVYVYRSTGSATTLGLILALGLLPGTIAAPFAGSLVDRWGSKRALLTANLGAMAVMAVMEVAMALISLYAPHLQAFQLSMPLKSLVGLVVLTLMLGVFFELWGPAVSDFLQSAVGAVSTALGLQAGPR